MNDLLHRLIRHHVRPNRGDFERALHVHCQRIVDDVPMGEGGIPLNQQLASVREQVSKEGIEADFARMLVQTYPSFFYGVEHIATMLRRAPDGDGYHGLERVLNHVLQPNYGEDVDLTVTVLEWANGRSETRVLEFQEGRFATITPLAREGGSVSVWLAWDSEQRRLVAVKVRVTQTEMEMMTQHLVGCDAVVQAIAFNVDEGWIAFAFRPRGDLRLATLEVLSRGGSRDAEPFWNYLRRRGDGDFTLSFPQDDERIRQMFSDLAARLHHMHEHQRVVHRALKPANLLIDDANRLVVTDFEKAGRRDEPAELDQNLPAWFADPHADTMVDPKSDVYSLCRTLAAVLAKRSRRPGESLAVFVEEIGLHPDFAQLLTRGSDPNPDQRPAMDTLADEFRNTPLLPEDPLPRWRQQIVDCKPGDPHHRDLALRVIDKAIEQNWTPTTFPGGRNSRYRCFATLHTKTPEGSTVWLAWDKNDNKLAVIKSGVSRQEIDVLRSYLGAGLQHVCPEVLDLEDGWFATRYASGGPAVTSAAKREPRGRSGQHHMADPARAAPRVSRGPSVRSGVSRGGDATGRIAR